VRAAGS